MLKNLINYFRIRYTLNALLTFSCPDGDLDDVCSIGKTYYNYTSTISQLFYIHLPSKDTADEDAKWLFKENARINGEFGKFDNILLVFSSDTLIENLLLLNDTGATACIMTKSSLDYTNKIYKFYSNICHKTQRLNIFILNHKNSTKINNLISKKPESELSIEVRKRDKEEDIIILYILTPMVIILSNFLMIIICSYYSAVNVVITESEMSRLEVRHYKQEAATNTVCCICYDEFEIDDLLITMKCRHLFHYQ